MDLPNLRLLNTLKQMYPMSGMKQNIVTAIAISPTNSDLSDEVKDEPMQMN